MRERADENEVSVFKRGCAYDSISFRASFFSFFALFSALSLTENFPPSLSLSFFVDRTSDPTPNTRKEVAKIHVLHKAKTDGKERVNGASGNTAFIRANTNKKKREKSALAEVIGKKDSTANEAIVEAIEEATFGELRACFPLVFDGRLTSSNNKEWLKAIMKRKLVTDKTYKFVPRTRYSSKNRLSTKKIQKTTKEIGKEEVTITKSENVPLKESGNGTTIPPSPSAKKIEEEGDDEELNVKKEVVFSVEVARREEQDEENGRVHDAIVTNAKINVSEVEPKDEDDVRKLSSIFTNTFSAVTSPIGTGLQK